MQKNFLWWLGIFYFLISSTMQENTKRYSLWKGEQNMREFVDDNFQDWSNEETANDRIWEGADSLCPVYYWEILAWAQDDPWLACENPEYETDSPMNAIQANIIQHLVEIGQEHWQEITEEKALPGERASCVA